MHTAGLRVFVAPLPIVVEFDAADLLSARRRLLSLSRRRPCLNAFRPPLAGFKLGNLKSPPREVGHPTKGKQMSELDPGLIRDNSHASPERPERPRIEPTAFVLCPNGLVFELKTELDAFCVTLGPNRGFLEFTRVATSESFQARRWLPDPSRGQGPEVSALSVLWTRQAAREADQGIAAFRAQGGWPREF